MHDDGSNCYILRFGDSSTSENSPLAPPDHHAKNKKREENASSPTVATPNPTNVCPLDPSMLIRNQGESETTHQSASKFSLHSWSYFAPEENKKASFILRSPVALRTQIECGRLSEKCNTKEGSSPKAEGSSIVAAADGSKNKTPTIHSNSILDVGDDAEDCVILDQAKNENNCSSPEIKRMATAGACLTCCTSASTTENKNATNTATSSSSKGSETSLGKDTPVQPRVPFLFGGFELIANVKSAKIFVTRPNESNEWKKTTKSNENEVETYLTTCKGIPSRNLPPFSIAPPEEVETINNRTSDGEEACLESNKDEISWYKFVFVSPGGPKPVKSVRFSFEKDDSTCPRSNMGGDSTKIKNIMTDISPSTSKNVIVRVLKVKCRLPENADKKTDTISQKSGQFPLSSTSDITGPENDASMMAMMGNFSSGRVQPTLPTNNISANGTQPTMALGQSPAQLPQQHNFHQMSMNPQMLPSRRQQQDQLGHQQLQRQMEKNQAEILSSIAGLGMFLKSSEERNRDHFEKALTEMEGRVMERLENLSNRLHLLEQHFRTDDNKAAATLDDTSGSEKTQCNDVSNICIESVKADANSEDDTASIAPLNPN